MRSAMASISGSRIPRVVTAGVPTRTPLATLGVRLLTEHETASRSPQRLVRRGRHEIRVRHRTRMNAGGDEARDVRHVREDLRADARASLADAGEVDHARVCAGADDDHL